MSFSCFWTTYSDLEHPKNVEKNLIYKRLEGEKASLTTFLCTICTCMEMGCHHSFISSHHDMLVLWQVGDLLEYGNFHRILKVRKNPKFYICFEVQIVCLNSFIPTLKLADVIYGWPHTMYLIILVYAVCIVLIMFPCFLGLW